MQTTLHIDEDLADSIKRGLLIGLAVLAVALPPAGVANLRRSTLPAPAQSVSLAAPVGSPRLADFGNTVPSPEARFIANWAADSGDNQRMNFVVIDKANTHVYVFDAQGKLVGDTPVLLGAAAGDDSVDGIGQRPIPQVRPEERTTPAGRFVAEPGRNANGEDVVWVDYDAAVSMHRVRATDPRERRLERLASPTTSDNRISYGCINMPVAFFEQVVKPAFDRRRGVVYVLPETRSLSEVFTQAYDVAERHRTPPSTG